MLKKILLSCQILLLKIAALGLLGVMYGFGLVAHKKKEG
jgi:hypothetical protein